MIFLRLLTDLISIFHYGGHANGSYLQLEVGAGKSQLANAVGLAGLLGQQQNLMLVFLNGCATKNQVKLLLENGVKSVIATSVPINDEMAVDFAEQFYKKLAGDSTIEDAFNFAKSYVETKYKEVRKISQHRDIEIDTEPVETISVEIPWGIYFKDKNKDILKWKLSDSYTLKEIKEIREKVARGDARKAIEIFLKISQNKPEIQDSLNMTSAKLTKVKKDEMLGMLDFSDVSRELARVNNSILQLLTEFEESFKK